MANLLTEAIYRLFSKPNTKMYPVKPADIAKGFRGKIEWKKDTCIFCMMCVTNCPTNALTMNKEKKTWAIDIGKCIFCGRCHDVCPTKPKSIDNSSEFELANTDKKKFKHEEKK